MIDNFSKFLSISRFSPDYVFAKSVQVILQNDYSSVLRLKLPTTKVVEKGKGLNNQ